MHSFFLLFALFTENVFYSLIRRCREDYSRNANAEKNRLFSFSLFIFASTSCIRVKLAHDQVLHNEGVEFF